METYSPFPPAGAPPAPSVAPGPAPAPRPLEGSRCARFGVRAHPRGRDRVAPPGRVARCRLEVRLARLDHERPAPLLRGRVLEALLDRHEAAGTGVEHRSVEQADLRRPRG